MIVLTGAAGFIGSYVAGKLNREGHRDLILVDEFVHPNKKANYERKEYRDLVNRSYFFHWLEGKEKDIQLIIHLGARTDTAESSWEIFENLNLSYSRKIWRYCAINQIPLIYASSAATYGNGEEGFDDNPEKIDQLTPMNPYGRSKHLFDLWALKQETKPPFWFGLKFFNVYGPNEYHKGRMASVVFHAFNQIKATGGLKLFRSHRPEFADGEQMRDFIAVADIAEVIYYLTNHDKDSGIYNLGTGVARYFKDLSNQVFRSMGLASNITFIDTPADIRDSYQYFTQAEMNRLRTIGYQKKFLTLEEGIDDYVRGYLLEKRYY